MFSDLRTTIDSQAYTLCRDVGPSMQLLWFQLAARSMSLNLLEGLWQEEPLDLPAGCPELWIDEAEIGNVIARIHLTHNMIYIYNIYVCINVKSKFTITFS